MYEAAEAMSLVIGAASSIALGICLLAGIFAVCASFCSEGKPGKILKTILVVSASGCILFSPLALLFVSDWMIPNAVLFDMAAAAIPIAFFVSIGTFAVGIFWTAVS